MECIEVSTINVSAKMGANPVECKRESIQLAMQERCIVKLLHNGVTYLVKPDDILSIVKESDE